MEYLPPELIYIILSETKIKNVTHFCQTNSYYRKLCQNEELWRDIYFRNFSDSQMNQLGIGWFALVKLCFQLNRVVEWLKQFGKIETILSLYRLKVLVLSGKQIKEIPVELGHLGETLQHLDLSDNQIKEIPTELGQLQALQNLYLCHNQIKEIPVELGHLGETLRELYLSHNQIEEIPVELGHLGEALRYLDLSGNQIKEIPVKLGHLQALQGLYLSHNQIKEIPGELGQLQALEELYLYDNAVQFSKENISLMFHHSLHIVV